MKTLLKRLQEYEDQGYVFESAEASCMTTLVRPRLVERQSVRSLVPMQAVSPG